MNLVNVILASPSNLTLHKSRVRGAVKTRFTDLLMTRKERIAIFAAWGQSKTMQEWQIAPRNVVVGGFP